MAAQKPIKEILEDLPVNWKNNDIVSPDGTSTGLTKQHGYNYLSGRVNELARGVNTINNAFPKLATTQDLETKLNKTGDASNVTNTFTQASSLTNLTTGEKLSVSLGKIMKVIAELISHIGNKNNPHQVTKSQVGLGNVDNTSDANKPISNATQQELTKINDKLKKAIYFK